MPNVEMLAWSVRTGERLSYNEWAAIDAMDDVFCSVAGKEIREQAEIDRLKAEKGRT